MNWIISGFGWGGVAITFGGFVAFLRGRIKEYQSFGCGALGSFIVCVCLILQRDHGLALYINAAGCAGFAWGWWNGGGGDDTRKRLRRWARKFDPVRRTAPQGV